MRSFILPPNFSPTEKYSIATGLFLLSQREICLKKRRFLGLCRPPIIIAVSK
jgi:hypothetical protein